jgi:hypothetical protein
VPTCPLALIGKLAFGCLSNMTEKKLEKLAQGLLAKTITIRDNPIKGNGRLDLKLMHKFTKHLKKKCYHPK